MNAKNQNEISGLPIDEWRNDMNIQTGSKSSDESNKRKFRFVLPILILLSVVVIGVFLASSVRVVFVSGKGESYVLESNHFRMGILYIDEGASAVFQKNSHWIGPVISKEGALIVQDDVTITGPVILFSNDLLLGENATVDGNLVLFSGSLTLQPGAIVRHNAVMFAGGVTLEQGASIRGDLISFSGGVALHERSSLRGDVVLFSGGMQIGSEATAYGKLISFFGGLELAPKAVLHDDAVLYFGNVHLYPEAQVRGDVIVKAGNATLDSQSTIYSKLYLNPESDFAALYKSSDAQILHGIIKPVNIESVADVQVVSLVLGNLFIIILMSVMVICLLMVLMYYFGRLTRSQKPKDGAKALYAEPASQPTTPGLR